MWQNRAGVGPSPVHYNMFHGFMQWLDISNIENKVCTVGPNIIYIALSYVMLWLSTDQWSLLLTWFNFNPSMDKQSHAW